VRLSYDISLVQGDVSSLQSAVTATGSTRYGGDLQAASAALPKAQAAVNAGKSSAIQQEAVAVETATGNCGLAAVQLPARDPGSKH
jgi:hypothetical protein